MCVWCAQVEDDKDGSAAAHRDTPSFIVAVACTGLFMAGARYASTKVTASFEVPGLQMGAAGLQAAVNTVCSTALFLLFCQGSPQYRDGQEGSSTFRMQQTYAEHAYTLSLLALFRWDLCTCFIQLKMVDAANIHWCRIMGTLSQSRLAKKEDAKDADQEAVDDTIPVLDVALGVASLLLMVLMFCTLQISIASGPDLTSR
jgi:hypothetical protein